MKECGNILKECNMMITRGRHFIIDKNTYLRKKKKKMRIYIQEYHKRCEKINVDLQNAVKNKLEKIVAISKY